MSELLPQIARITRLLSKNEGVVDTAPTKRVVDRVVDKSSQSITFPLYDRIRPSTERINWKIQSVFATEYLSADHTIFDQVRKNTAAPDAIKPTGMKPFQGDEFEFSQPNNAASLSSATMEVLKAKIFLNKYIFEMEISDDVKCNYFNCRK